MAITLSGHVARMVNIEELIECLMDLETGANVILKWILKKLDGIVWAGLFEFRIGENATEHGSEISPFNRLRDFIQWPRNY